MSKLNILWTNADPTTAEMMVFMYAINGMKREWWDELTLIIWGATANLAAENETIKGKIREAKEAGVHISACRACADHLGVTPALEEQGIEVKYWGTDLTEILKADGKLLTV